MKTQEENIKIPKSEYDKLHRELSELKSLVNEQMDNTIKLHEEIESLNKVIKDQKEIIETFKGKKVPIKNSRNSDLPPSKDLYRIDTRRSLRKKSEKQSGGQPGHKGNHLKFSASPDDEINLIVEGCENCGLALGLTESKLKGSRQVIDLRSIEVRTTQINRYESTCDCGHKTIAEYPEHVKGQVQYGPRIRSLINYLSVRQFVPFKRLREMMSDCFGIKLSEGFIANTLKRSSEKALGIYNHIKDQIEYSNNIGTDETTIYTNGKKNTLWTWQNADYTYLSVSNSRHGIHIGKNFYHGFPNGILTSDQYAAHLGTVCKGHQLCWVHLLRKIAYLTEIQDHHWLKKLKLVYKKAKRLKAIKKSYSRNSILPKGLELELNNLLLMNFSSKTHGLIIKFQKSLRKNRQHLLTFLYYAEVTPDNNSSEQAIRNAKVKMKISGGFKSLQHSYAIMRSVIDTAIKNDKNILNIISNIETGKDISFA